MSHDDKVCQLISQFKRAGVNFQQMLSQIPDGSSAKNNCRFIDQSSSNMCNTAVLRQFIWFVVNTIEMIQIF
jgi:hypothetical protein